MPSCGELQAPIAIAIADLEQIKRQLLDVFEWAGLPQMVSDQERSKHLMTLELARVTLPLAEHSISQAIRLLIPKEGVAKCRDVYPLKSTSSNSSAQPNPKPPNYSATRSI